jgi:hypothetical protein
MQTVRYIVILTMVLIASAATLLMAQAWAGLGAPVWQALVGPLLLAAMIGMRWLSRTK